MVYGVAFCPEAWKDSLDNLGFAGAFRSSSSPMTAPRLMGIRRFKDPQPRETNWTAEHPEQSLGAYGVVRKGSMVRRVLRALTIYRVTFRRQPSGNIERDVEDTID